MKKEIKQLEIDHTPLDAFILDDSEVTTSTNFKHNFNRLIKAVYPDGQFSLTSRSSILGMNGSKVEAAFGNIVMHFGVAHNQKDEVPGDD